MKQFQVNDTLWRELCLELELTFIKTTPHGIQHEQIENYDYQRTGRQPSDTRQIPSTLSQPINQSGANTVMQIGVSQLVIPKHSVHLSS